jgi:serine/threonine-protein kinase
MGAVYLVEHVHMRKRLALKVLLQEVSNSEEVAARFEREAMAAAHIDHPNIVGATDFGRTEDGALFLVLEYVEGQSLREILAHGRLTPLRALTIATQIASALARAHSMGIVHRDLKPENVMLLQRAGSEELVKVLDFGIAKMNPNMSDGAPTPGSTGPILTRAGAIFGTPEYMSPEQAMGEAVDARTDLYALGITLYEMLTGQRPFDAANAVAMLTMHLTATPPPMSVRTPGVEIPPALETLTMRLLAKKPDERPASGADVVAELERIRLESFAPPASRPDLSPASRPAAISLANAPAGVATAPTALAPLARLRLTAPLAKARTMVSPILARIPAERRPLVRWIAGAVGFVLLVTVVTLAFRPSKKDDEAKKKHVAAVEPSASKSWLSFEKKLSADKLKSAIAGGVPELEKLAREYPDDTRVPREIVRAEIAQQRYSEAMAALTRVIAMDPRAVNDADMVAAVDAALDSDSGFEAGLKMLEGPFGARGVDILIERSGQPGPAKQRFVKSLAKPEVRAQATPAAAVALELREAKTCKDKRAAVEHAESVGDIRALSLMIPLRKVGGCGFFGMGDCWGCLRKDDTLDSAISAVERRQMTR